MDPSMREVPSGPGPTGYYGRRVPASNIPPAIRVRSGPHLGDAAGSAPATGPARAAPTGFHPMVRVTNE